MLGGLDGDESRLDAALAMYQSTLRERTRLIFEYTLRAASLKDPAPTLPLYRKLAQSREDTTRFMDVLAGEADFRLLFNSSKIPRSVA